MRDDYNLPHGDGVVQNEGVDGEVGIVQPAECRCQHSDRCGCAGRYVRSLLTQQSCMLLVDRYKFHLQERIMHIKRNQASQQGLIVLSLASLGDWLNRGRHAQGKMQASEGGLSLYGLYVKHSMHYSLGQQMETCALSTIPPLSVISNTIQHEPCTPGCSSCAPGLCGVSTVAHLLCLL